MPLSQLIPGIQPSDTIQKAAEVAGKTSKFTEKTLQEYIDLILTNLVSFSLKLALAVAIFIVGRWLINRIEHLLTKLMERRNVDLSLRTFLESLLKITLMITLIIIIIGVLGINTSSFVALFASAGVAVGMALSGTLQNFAGGVMILLFKPYKVGDFIEAQGQTGVVKQIQIINTILNTPDNKVIIIPNGGLSTGIINNYSKEGVRRVDWQFGIAYGNDYEMAKKVIAELIEADSRIHLAPEPFIALHSLGDSSVNIVVRVWANVEDYWAIYFDMNENVYKTFPQYGLSIPFPQMDVHVHKATEA